MRREDMRDRWKNIYKDPKAHAHGAHLLNRLSNPMTVNKEENMLEKHDCNNMSSWPAQAANSKTCRLLWCEHDHFQGPFRFKARPVKSQ